MDGDLIVSKEILPRPHGAPRSRVPLWDGRLVRASGRPSESSGLELAFPDGPGCPEQDSGSQLLGEAAAEVVAPCLQEEWSVLGHQQEPKGQYPSLPRAP